MPRRSRYRMDQGFGQRFTPNLRSPQARGLVVWWPPLGSRGTNVLRDFSGRGNAGVFPGGAANPTWARDSRFGSVLSLDGDDYITRQTGVVTETPVSMSAWILATAAGGDDARILGVYVNGATRVIGLFHHTATGVVTAQHYDGTNSSAVSTTDVLGAWFHVAGVFSSDSSRTIYINGIPEDTDITVRGPIGAIDVFTVGRNEFAAPGQYFNGRMGDVRVANVAWTPAEVWHQFAPETRWDLYRTPGMAWAQAPVAAGIPRHWMHYARQRYG